MLVKELMASPGVTVGAGTPPPRGARDTAREELERIYAMARKLKAKDVMSERVETIAESDDVGSAVHRMLTRNLKHLPVVRDGTPVGMVARHDVLKLLGRGVAR